jgi:hypothetical protein
LDVNCNATSAHPGQAGTITFSTITSATLQGSFDITLDNGDKLSGTFSAPVCSADLNKFVNSPTSTSCGH